MATLLFYWPTSFLSLSLYCHLKPTSFGLDDLLYMRVQRSGLKAVFEGLPYDS